MGYVELHLRSDVHGCLRYCRAMHAIHLAVGYVAGKHPYVSVAPGHHAVGQLGSHEVTESFKAAVNYSHLDPLAAVPGVVPGSCAVGLDSLAGDIAIHRPGRNYFPHADDTGLLRELSQQGYRHVGFHIVLAHVAGIAAVDYQELHHLVHILGQVDDHRHRAAGVYG